MAHSLRLVHHGRDLSILGESGSYHANGATAAAAAAAAAPPFLGLYYERVVIVPPALGRPT